MSTVEKIIIASAAENSDESRKKKLLAEVAAVRERLKVVGVQYDIKPALTAEQKAERDNRSIFVGNVGIGTTSTGLTQHFESCGEITSITVIPKGFAFIEFKNVASIAKALRLTNSVFAGKSIMVKQKRTNTPGMRNNRVTVQRHHPYRCDYQRGDFRGRGAPPGRRF